ncbi:MAG: dTMP kinase [Gemmatimonadetes bacterium]|nr:dTMP kinase [Gemmatimonadota bacterium]
MSVARSPRAGGGALITFEGGEASGKSTQVELLAGWLTEEGYSVVTAREPGTTAVGLAARSALLDVDDELAPHAELALFIAARAQLAATVVTPALAAGKVVLLDRFGDSSVAYQGYGRGLEPERIAEWNRWATGGLVADLTILIDVSVSDAVDRRGDKPPDRLERAGDEFHERVRAGYKRLATNEPCRFFVLDGKQPIDELQSAIRSRVGELLETGSSQRMAPE